MGTKRTVLQIDGREVGISNPEKVFFPALGITKLDLVGYYRTLAGPVLTGVRGRPMGLKRYVDGIEGEAFYQKRAPANRPAWLETVQLRYPSGGVADEVVVRHEADLAWLVNLGCVDLHPHPVRADDLAHPDELRIDLDPNPGVGWPAVREVAMAVRDVLVDCGLTGWPKTSGSRGLHILVRIQPLWTFADLRRAGLTVARLVEDRVPSLATSRWWKEERHGVFVDYNQNAKDRTQASAYSVRPTADARVSTPLRWEEVPDSDPAEHTIATVPARVARHGDPAEGIDEAAGSLRTLLELADLHRAQGREEPSAAGGQRAAAAPGKTSGASGRRRSSMPMIEVARAASKAEALAGLERWKARHAEVWPMLAEDDVLVDSMRGRSSLWYRVRLNLRHVPAEQRPEQEALEVDYDPFAAWREHPEALQQWRASRRRPPAQS